jgi:glycosidase
MPDAILGRMTRHSRLPRPRRLVAAAIVVPLLFAACGSANPSGAPATSGSPGIGASPSSAPPAAPSCPPSRGPAADRPWWADRIFYEVFVRSFADSDDDGVGDLRGLIERLDYLNDGDPATDDDLGVTGLWLMPIADAASYHGYDVVDYRTIEPDYGTADDFRELMAQAHERGIAIIVDLVLNHTSRDHPWFQDALTPGSAHDDWYLWEETRPPVAKSDGSRVWHEADGRFYYGYFWEGMPDLDLENPEVTAELDDIGRFWIDEMGVDGFRLDAARHLIEDGDELENTPATLDWLADWRERLKADRPDVLVLGEVYDSSSMTARYVREGSLDLTFEFGLASATITSLNSRDAGSIAAAHREIADAYPPDTVATFLTNHDQNRVAAQLGGDLEAQKLAATLLLSGRGVPFIYYGEEIGMSGRKPDERIRAPMRWDASEPGAGFSVAEPWQPLGDDPPGADVATQDADPDSLLETYRSLVRLRAAHPALLSGAIVPIDASDRHVVAYLRSDGDRAVLVVANLGTEPVTAPKLALESGPLCGAPGVDVLAGPADATAPRVTAEGGFDAYVPIAHLGPREALIVALDGE